MFRKAFYTMLASALLVAGGTASAFAEDADQNFTLHNHWGASLVHLYVSPHSSDNWGSDLMPSGKELPDGGSVDIVFSPDNTVCHYDIRGEFEDGSTKEKNDVNLCERTDVSLDG